MEVQIDLPPMEGAAVLEGQVSMPLPVLPEFRLDRRGFALVHNVHDNPDPGEDVSILWRVGWAHRTGASCSPPLLDGRSCSNAFTLDYRLQLYHVVDVCQRRFVDRAAWDAVLQNPLCAATLESEDLHAVCDALAGGPLPELSLSPVHPCHVLCIQRVQHEALLTDLREVDACQVATVWLELPQQLRKGSQSVAVGKRRCARRIRLGSV
mmetsp:Transcript_46387/g.75402  ORF Transcript_46387/g.75402 Transcript_46387/m.75402 type:complete len:209 (-) Transcript_46387:174-800(-)